METLLVVQSALWRSVQKLWGFFSRPYVTKGRALLASIMPQVRFGTSVCEFVIYCLHNKVL